MLSREAIMQVKKLINAEISTRNPKAQIYDRIPQENDGYDGEIRLVALRDRVWQFERVNKSWWCTELGNPSIKRWDDIRVAANSVRLPASNAPTWTAYKSSQVLSFSASQTNTIHFQVQLPHSREEGSDIIPHFHFVPSSTNTGNIYAQLTYSWANVNGVFPAATTITKVVACDGTTDKHQIGDFGPIDGSGKTLSSMLLCSFSRVGGNASDTFTGEMYLMEFDFHILIDGDGSINEYTKEIIRIGR